MGWHQIENIKTTQYREDSHPKHKVLAVVAMRKGENNRTVDRPHDGLI